MFGSRKCTLLFLSSIMFVTLLLNAPASSQDCVDYSIPGPVSAVTGLDFSGSCSGNCCTFLRASGGYLSVRYFILGDDVEGVSFYEENPAAELELLFCDVSLTFSYEGGYGSNHIGTYRRQGPWGGVPVQQNFVIDLSIPGTPIGELDHYGKTWIHGDNAYVLVDDYFWAYSLADIENPQLIGTFSAPSNGSVYSLNFFDGFVAILVPGDILEIWNISNPATWVQLASEELPIHPENMTSGLDFVLISGDSQGLLKVDLSDPAHPGIPESSWDFGVEVNSAALKYPYVYFVSGNDIRVLNLESNPPELLPAVIGANWGSLSMGIHQIFFRVDTWAARLPLDCGNITPVEKRSLGSLKSLFLDATK